MKKRTIVCASLAVACVLGTLTSCSDTLFGSSFSSKEVEMRITLNMPGASSSTTRAIATRVAGNNTEYKGTDYTTALQYYIGDNDIYVLLFEEDGDEEFLYGVPRVTLDGQNGDWQRTATTTVDKTIETLTIYVDVLTNLAQNACFGKTTYVDVQAELVKLIGKSREKVYEAIGTFDCPEVTEDNPYGVWTLSEDDKGRYLPMWGVASNRLILEEGSDDTWFASCPLYRSVAKMGFTIDADCSTFDLKEIYVYYSNNEGTFIEEQTTTNWNEAYDVQYTLPNVPEEVTSRDIMSPLVYKLEEAITSGEQYLDHIYLAEADNRNNASNPVCVVVGGIYKGGDYNGEGLSDDDYPLDYYRIDLRNNAADNNPTGGVSAFDLIRNHSYIFNIKSANSPGTSDPDPRRATAGLTVEILDYTEVPMYGINSQYVLTVSKSLFTFEGITTDVGELLVTTNKVDWQLVTDWSDIEELQPYTEEGVTSTPNWVRVTDTTGEGNHTDTNDLITIEPRANLEQNNYRTGCFWIKAGNIYKRIDIAQSYDETANSYIVTTEGSHDLKVDIRGNGNTFAWANADGTSTVDIGFDLGSDISDVAYAAIIWETADGFITIPDAEAISESGTLEYVVNNVDLSSHGDWRGNVFDSGNGANALIGVFDSNDQLLWSYHIWALGDYANGNLEEDWVVGGTDGTNTYHFMDRNLGAYSNLPGSKSFGLLYQWGRKDPFIGAYRESSERDYRQVRRQYTKHYPQKNGRTYYWSTFNDTGTTESEDVIDCIENPTSILEEGLLTSSDNHSTKEAHGLWGTTSYEYVNADTGNKTMYDPCPVGYRMPSINALRIWDGYNDLFDDTNSQVHHSSLSCRFVPVPEDSDYRTGNGYGADFVSDAPFYGFWLDYANNHGFNAGAEPTSTDGNNTTYVTPEDNYSVNYYSATTLTNGTCGWMTGYSDTNPGKPADVTWIPMGGILNGTVNHFGRAGLTDVGPDGDGPGGDGPGGDGGGSGGGGGGPGGGGGGPAPRRKADAPKGDGDGMLPASSLQVTSVLWANSPTPRDENYPAGLLIHGTEGAYAPHYYDDEGELTPYYYSTGTITSATTGTGNGREETPATQGPGYWIKGTSGYDDSTGAACGWWSGSVDYNSSGMASGIEQGHWNAYGEENRTYIDNNYDSTYWYDENGFSESGRHFHSYMDTTESTYANPSYAASVRCIRDKDAFTYNDDLIEYPDGTHYSGDPLELYFYDSTGAIQDEIDLVIQYVTSWEVTNPGAKWISIEPSSGTSGSAYAISDIKITYNADYLSEAVYPNDTAPITIKFARGDTKTITVTYVGGTRPSN